MFLAGRTPATEPDAGAAAAASRILVVGPSWVGDMVMAQSLLALLKQREPGCRIDVVAPQSTRPLLDFMPEVDRAVVLPVGRGRLGLAERYRLGRRLRSERYDRAIVLPRAFKAALVPFWAAAKRRTGYLGELRFGLLNDRRRDPGHAAARTVDRFAALAALPGERRPEPPMPRLHVALARVAAALADLALTRPTGRLLALCPGAEFGPSKRWPVEHFAAVARAWHERGGAVWLIGGPGDVAAGEAIAAAAGEGCLNLAGRTDLGQAVALLSLADAVISNDSGLMHVAAALQRPQLALFGSSSPEITPPLSDRARTLWLGLACSPCFKRQCPLGHHNCLRELRPELAIDALDELGVLEAAQ